MGLQHWLAISVLVLIGTAQGSSDIAKLEARLEEQRLSIERDRKSLNADCGPTVAKDAAKTEDCKTRNADVKRRMAQYKLDLALLESKQNAGTGKCQSIKEKIAHFEDGIKRIEINMGKNEKFIKGAEDAKKEAVGEVVKTAGEVAGSAAAGALQDRLAKFIKAKKRLEIMKKGVDEYEKLKGTREYAHKLSKEQITQARQWINKGMKYGEEVVDAGSMTVDYYNGPHSGNKPDATLNEKLINALNDFDKNFMQDGGGWEFAGEHLAKYGGGPAGELAFRSAVIALKVGVASLSYRISDAELAKYRENQNILRVERLQLQQKINELKASLVNNHCP